MKINVAKSAGFCFGVKRAIRIALDAATSGSEIEMLGDIVHNEDVVRDIQSAGIRKVRYLARNRKKILLVRAHGIPLRILRKARSLGYAIIDATCPMVKEIHKIAIGMEGKGRKVIVIGDKSHDEVKGIVGHLKYPPLVIDSLENIAIGKIKKIKRAAVVVQSTQNIKKVKQIFGTLKRYIKDLKLFNTVCTTTGAKQKEIRNMPLKNQLMIIIGSKTSANTRRLYEISKSLNKKSYWVQSEKNLRKSWFKGVKSVGIHAGASTPDYVTQSIIGRIKQLTAHSRR
ncbi:4-hydroxy-3-methylbut-2-enyl diphosphate reductase [Candidatus Omnitrophota bacterium]